MPIKWKKQLISTERYESVGVFDVTGDGRPNIVSGAYWYETPDIASMHVVGEIRQEGDYYDDFSTIPMDVNGNGRLDFITGGWWGDTIRWRENPGDPDKEWHEHIIAKTGNVETVRAWDIDGDGEVELIPNCPGEPLKVFKLVAPEKFAVYTLYDQPQGHGLGCGDINGNGRMDIVLAGGWLEAPEKPFEQEWIFHPEFNFGTASVPILVVDVNRNGISDLIVGQAHGYGLDWWEQRVSADGSRQWIQHPIDPYNGQYHDMFWIDLDGDGECELVTGKRYRAHVGRDISSADDLGIYYFKWNGESFSKQVISYGPPGTGKGCGISFAIADLKGNGRLDIVAPGKDGLYWFENLGL